MGSKGTGYNLNKLVNLPISDLYLQKFPGPTL